MRDWEFYWDVVSWTATVGMTLIRAYFLCCFVKPFLQKKKRLALAGIGYTAAMLVMAYYPEEINVMAAYAGGVLAGFGVVYFIDRRNVEQKFFLAVIFYLLKWVTSGIVLIPWQFFYDLLLRFFGMGKNYPRQLLLYAIAEAADLAMNYLSMAFCIRVIHKEYRYKTENLMKRELALMLAPLFSIVAGEWGFRFVVDAYEKDTRQYIWNNHYVYSWYQEAYMLVSFAAMLTIIISYQRIRNGRRKEKEDAVLAGQIEDMKRHISEVENLYRDIRGLKHDMGNHIMTLEKLCGEDAEAGAYIMQLKEQVKNTTPEMHSGNPITDVILREKKKEAEEKKIIFESRFVFPEDTKLSAFDISVILNNALNNAIEAAEECEEPYISVSSYSQKNARMIEVRNSAAGKRIIDEESGLPFTTKEGAEHGFGLTNIRKVARKYYGDIAIEQDGKEFGLVIMLMA